MEIPNEAVTDLFDRQDRGHAANIHKGSHISDASHQTLNLGPGLDPPKGCRRKNLAGSLTTHRCQTVLPIQAPDEHIDSPANEPGKVGELPLPVELILRHDPAGTQDVAVDYVSIIPGTNHQSGNDFVLELGAFKALPVRALDDLRLCTLEQNRLKRGP